MENLDKQIKYKLVGNNSFFAISQSGGIIAVGGKTVYHPLDFVDYKEGGLIQISLDYQKSSFQNYFNSVPIVDTIIESDSNDKITIRDFVPVVSEDNYDTLVRYLIVDGNPVINVKTDVDIPSMFEIDYFEVSKTPGCTRFLKETNKIINNQTLENDLVIILHRKDCSIVEIRERFLETFDDFSKITLSHWKCGINLSVTNALSDLEVEERIFENAIATSLCQDKKTGYVLHSLLPSSIKADSHKGVHCKPMDLFLYGAFLKKFNRSEEANNFAKFLSSIDLKNSHAETNGTKIFQNVQISKDYRKWIQFQMEEHSYACLLLACVEIHGLCDGENKLQISKVAKKIAKKIYGYYYTCISLTHIVTTEKMYKMDSVACVFNCAALEKLVKADIGGFVTDLDVFCYKYIVKEYKMKLNLSWSDTNKCYMSSLEKNDEENCCVDPFILFLHFFKLDDIDEEKLKNTVKSVEEKCVENNVCYSKRSNSEKGVPYTMCTIMFHSAKIDLLTEDESKQVYKENYRKALEDQSFLMSDLMIINGEFSQINTFSVGCSALFCLCANAFESEIIKQMFSMFY